MITKEQRRRYRKTWRTNHPAAAKAANNRWREKHKDEINAKAAIWRANNPDKVKSYRKSVKDLTPGQLEAKREYIRTWRSNHPAPIMGKRKRNSGTTDCIIRARQKRKEDYPAKYRHRFRNGEASKCKRWAINDMQIEGLWNYVMSEYLVMGLRKYPELIVPIDTCQL